MADVVRSSEASAEERSAYRPQNDPGVYDEPDSSAVEVPVQADYRANPNLGQTATAEHDASDRDHPNTRGFATSPQPEVPNAGYSVNGAPARPNAMTPHPSKPTGIAADPSSIGAWDMWETT